MMTRSILLAVLIALCNLTLAQADPGDGIADLYIYPDGSAVIDPDGGEVQAFDVRSPGHHLTGQAALPPAALISANTTSQCAIFVLDPGFTIPWSLGDLVADVPAFKEEVARGTAHFDYGNRVIVPVSPGDITFIPEPASIALLALASPLLLRRRHSH